MGIRNFLSSGFFFRSFDRNNTINHSLYQKIPLAEKSHSTSENFLGGGGGFFSWNEL